MAMGEYAYSLSLGTFVREGGAWSLKG